MKSKMLISSSSSDDENNGGDNDDGTPLPGKEHKTLFSHWCGNQFLDWFLSFAAL